MYDLLLRYLARVFVPNPTLDLRAQTFADFAAALGDPKMVPRPVLELGQGGVAPRLAVASLGGSWLVQVTSESIDVQYTPRPQAPPIDFPTFCASAGTYLTGAVSFFGARASRIAVVQEGLLPKLSEPSMEASAQRLFQMPEPFKAHRAIEWDWRVAVEVPRTFAGLDELTNTIAAVRRVEVQAPIDDVRLLFAVDVNTKPKETKLRFDAPHIEGFVAEAASWHADLASSVLDFAGIE